MSTQKNRIHPSQQKQLEQGLITALHDVFRETPPTDVRNTMFKIMHDWLSAPDRSMLTAQEDLYVLWQINELANAYQQFEDVVDGREFLG